MNDLFVGQIALPNPEEGMKFGDTGHDWMLVLVLLLLLVLRLHWEKKNSYSKRMFQQAKEKLMLLLDRLLLVRELDK